MSPATPSRTTLRVRLSRREFLDLLLGLCIVVCTVLKFVLFTAAPWHAIPIPGKVRRKERERGERKKQKRDYWRRICVALIRAGGDRFSIRQLQYLMPSTTQTVRTWSQWRGVELKTEVVPSLRNERMSAPSPASAVHWIGGCPPESGIQDHERVLLYVHGGGFVLPISHGHLDLLWYIREKINSELCCTVHIAAVEYSIAPYSRHPVQLEQVVQSLFYLLEHYRIPPSSLVLAGDSCGGALCISTLSHLLHPHPSVSVAPAPAPSTRSSADSSLLPAPLAGVLLLSPWTSFATTSASYRNKCLYDSLTPSIIRRFRGAFLSGTDVLPTTSEADAWLYASARGDASVPSRIEEDPVLLEPLVPWNGDERRGYWLQATEAPLDWWTGIEDVVSHVMITAGMLECFRDDILSFKAKLRTLTKRDGSGPALQVSSFLDHAVHATPVNDFAFGIEPSEQMEHVVSWLKQRFQPQE